MKLLYISTLDHIVRVMLPHLDGAKAVGYETHVACQFTRFRDDVAAHADGLHHVPIQRNPLDPRNVLALFQLVRLIRKLQPDIVHCHNPSGGFYGRLAATIARTGAKRVYTAHGFHFHPLGGKLSNALYRAIESFAGRFLSDAVLTINQWDFEEAKKLMPPERVHFTHGVGVSTDEFDPMTVTAGERQAIRDEFGVPEEGILLTCIGELVPRKNQELLLWAMADQETGTLADKLRLVIVGDGMGLESLRALAQKLHVENVVHFTGFRRDTKAILAAANLFVFPSLQEGLPCAVQEALCMEVPVLCFQIRGAEDLVDTQCGVQVNHINSCRVFTNALVDFLLKGSPDVRKALGRAGRQKMIEHYSRSVCVAEWLAIYNKISPTLPSLSRYREGGAGGGRGTDK
ncbi:glycosyltransferase family 4 protein [Armatimonas sp.]|uniref:glycosyltransferase family 4 protein n=1 Tax=Armatimonas sp. TaxID=1872638 RepID=UPI00286C79D3|nr:glycosyltransferase family 4 protein [Armatimonas sp.]